MTNLCLKLALGALELVVRVHVRTERGSRVRREGAQVAVVDLQEDWELLFINIIIISHHANRFIMLIDSHLYIIISLMETNIGFL